MRRSDASREWGGGGIVPRWVLSLLLAGCVAAEPPDRTPRPHVADDLTADPPVEVAILPLPPAPNLGEEERRAAIEAAYDELLERGYTPLNPDWVARRLAEHALEPPYTVSALAAALGADAYLELVIERLVRLPTVEPPRVEVEGRATLLDGVTGAVLFQQRLASSSKDEGDPLSAHLAREVRRLLLELPARSASSPFR